MENQAGSRAQGQDERSDVGIGRAMSEGAGGTRGCNLGVEL